MFPLSAVGVPSDRGKRSWDLRRMRAPILVLGFLVSGAPAARAQTDLPPPGRSALRILGYALGGAIVGSWTGYVASQVTWSDWSNPDGRSAHRVRFSVGGAAVGLVAGLVMGSHRTRATPLPAPFPAPRLAAPLPNRPITEDEIRTSSARSVTELVRRLRPYWLRSRGRDRVFAGQDAVEALGVRVYLNGSLLGGVDAMDQIAVDALTGVSFLEANAAVLRFGAGNEDGAILLTTRPGA